MALYTEETARACIRVQDGKRVFFLEEGDRLTPAAQEWLRQNHVAIVHQRQAPPQRYQTLFGAELLNKPEYMTHLTGNTLVFKDHPRIRFRGMLDTLQADILLAQQAAKTGGCEPLFQKLQEALDFVRSLIRSDVLGEPVSCKTLCSLKPDELRAQSHRPQDYYGQPHFMPDGTMSPVLLWLNKVRTTIRQTELAAYAAFRTPDGAVKREDILLWLNRLSSLFWILMIQCKVQMEGRQANGTVPERP